MLLQPLLSEFRAPKNAISSRKKRKKTKKKNLQGPPNLVATLTLGARKTEPGLAVVLCRSPSLTWWRHFEPAGEHQRKHAKIQGPVISKSSQVFVPAQRQKGPCVFRKFTTFLTSPKLTAGSKFRRVRYRFHKEISENSLKKIAAPLRPYPCLRGF